MGVDEVIVSGASRRIGHDVYRDARGMQTVRGATGG